MYKKLTKQDFWKILKVADDYSVDALIVVGTNPRSKEYPDLYEALNNLGIKYEEEKIEDSFFGEVKSFVIKGKRVWFDVVYGAAYLSELTHVASLLGSKLNILLGSCGGLQKKLETMSTIIPEMSFADESFSRMYQKGGNIFEHKSDSNLSNLIKKYLLGRKNVYGGNQMTIQAMLAETEEDIKLWNNRGYIGVDMESSVVFAVSNYFNVPSAALLYVAENLVKNELITDDSFALKRQQRRELKKENYEIAFRVVLDEINK